MAGLLKMIVGVAVVAAGLITGSAVAQETGNRTTFEEGRDQSEYYQQSAYAPNARQIIHEKAQTRAAQRQARLASLSWYGMSNARPTAAPTPFTSLYSPVWQMSGHRPFAWHGGSRAAYVFYGR